MSQSLAKSQGPKPHGGYCKECRSDFRTPEALATHRKMKMDAAEGHIHCRICGLLFATIDGLRLHHNQTHATEQSLQCPGCGEYFTRVGSLMMHIEGNKCHRISKADVDESRKSKLTMGDSLMGLNHGGKARPKGYFGEYLGFKPLTNSSYAGPPSVDRPDHWPALPGTAASAINSGPSNSVSNMKAPDLLTGDDDGNGRIPSPRRIDRNPQPVPELLEYSPDEDILKFDDPNHSVPLMTSRDSKESTVAEEEVTPPKGYVLPHLRAKNKIIGDPAGAVADARTKPLSHSGGKPANGVSTEHRPAGHSSNTSPHPPQDQASHGLSLTQQNLERLRLHHPSNKSKPSVCASSDSSDLLLDVDVSPVVSPQRAAIKPVTAADTALVHVPAVSSSPTVQGKAVERHRGASGSTQADGNKQIQKRGQGTEKNGWGGHEGQGWEGINVGPVTKTSRETTAANGGQEDFFNNDDPNHPEFKVMAHYRSWSKRFHCPKADCKKSFPSDRGLIAHLESVAHQCPGKLQCPYCLKYFKSAAALTQHSESQSLRCGIRHTDEFRPFFDQLTGGVADVVGVHNDSTNRYEVTQEALDKFGTRHMREQKAMNMMVEFEERDKQRREEYWQNGKGVDW